ncbi:MAG: hypothetical protein ABIH25_05070 [Candidatus Woesearchaeota archaeon]
MNKRGYMKTLEALLAIVIFLVALFAILSVQPSKEDLKPQDIELMQDTILNQIQHNEVYRTEIQNDNIGIGSDIYTFINDRLPFTLDFIIKSCDDVNTNCNIDTDPKYIDFQAADKVYADSIIISEETENPENSYQSRLFILYLWRK